jgi:hypothetical protein
MTISVQQMKASRGRYWAGWFHEEIMQHGLEMRYPAFISPHANSPPINYSEFCVFVQLLRRIT